MPIKNYAATKGAAYYIGKTQESLINHGAIGISMQFDGIGRVDALMFTLPGKEGNRFNFQLPCNWRNFQKVLKDQDVRRSDEEEYCYKVAWANIMDWVEAQMALYETEMVTLPQIFLPFVTSPNGRTLFELVSENPKLLLG